MVPEPRTGSFHTTLWPGERGVPGSGTVGMGTDGRQQGMELLRSWTPHSGHRLSV
jgi:hypothetical protein